MIMSFHVADVGVRNAIRALRCAPKPSVVPGLRHSDISFAAALSPSPIPKPSPHRIAVVSLWDDDEALDRYLEAGSLASLMARGWHVRLEPLRATGSWPGLASPAHGSDDEHDAPTVVLTLGRLRVRRAVAFFRTSAKAEGQTLRSPGLIWATGMGLPPFVGTCSLWRNTRSLTDFAYRQPSDHGNAMDADRHEPFHRTSAFVRLRPYRSVGCLTGANPLPATWLEPDPVAPLDRGRTASLARPAR